jgi:hypothetical protein
MSLYHSLKHTGKPLGFIFGTKTRAEISSNAHIDIERIFMLGARGNLISLILGGPSLHIKSGTSFAAHELPRVGGGIALNI